MKVMRIRRICDVRGCGNTDCYIISRSREFAGSVIICESCLKAVALALAPKQAEQDSTQDVETAGFKCEKFGKTFKTDSGLKKHKCTGGDE